MAFPTPTNKITLGGNYAKKKFKPAQPPIRTKNTGGGSDTYIDRDPDYDIDYGRRRYPDEIAKEKREIEAETKKEISPSRGTIIKKTTINGGNSGPKPSLPPLKEMLKNKMRK